MALCLAVAMFAVPAYAQLNNMEERGSVLVWPLIDNVNYLTVVEIANATSLPSITVPAPVANVTLECHVHTHAAGQTAEDGLVKLDFRVEMTPQEVFLWETYLPASQQGKSGLPNLAGRKGFLFCFAINPATNNEIQHDFLKGDAVLFALAGARAGQSFLYNAIPSQTVALTDANGNRTLTFGTGGATDYTGAPGLIYFEGFATANPDFGPLEGELVVANLDIDFLTSSQPEFDINFNCYNEDEDPASNHTDFVFYEQYDMTTDLFLDFANVQTRKWQCNAIASGLIGPNLSYFGMWAITYQYGGTYAIGENVWQALLPAGIAPNVPLTTVTLPIVPAGS
jgi:hypothetical protein